MSILLHYTAILKPLIGSESNQTGKLCLSDRVGLTNEVWCDTYLFAKLIMHLVAETVCLVRATRMGWRYSIFTYIYTVHSTIRTTQLLNSIIKFKCRTVINVCHCVDQSTIYCIHEKDRCQRDWSL